MKPSTALAHLGRLPTRRTPRCLRSGSADPAFQHRTRIVHFGVRWVLDGWEDDSSLAFVGAPRGALPLLRRAHAGHLRTVRQGVELLLPPLSRWLATQRFVNPAQVAERIREPRGWPPVHIIVIGDWWMTPDGHNRLVAAHLLRRPLLVYYRVIGEPQ